MNKVPIVQAVVISHAASATPSVTAVAATTSGVSHGTDNVGAREYLAANKWPIGLQNTFVENLALISMRFFICDDSGSMMASDGHKLLTNASGQQKYVQCTRWQELTDALKFHANLAHASRAPTEFRLLNSDETFLVGTDNENESERLAAVLRAFEKSPGGGTPLCKHIRAVTEKIRTMEGSLRASGQKACVIIATDGESSDGDIISAMQPLRQLPVWVVVRLCTDEDRIVDYWNNIDSQLEVEMDVLDDLCGEAEEVMQNNSWLTYGEPMHRLREFGVLIKEIDMMDSNRLSLDQIRKFCAIIFGGSVDSYPHPELDFSGFLSAVRRQNDRTSKVWDPITKRMRPWIKKSALYAMYPASSMCTVS